MFFLLLGNSFGTVDCGLHIAPIQFPQGRKGLGLAGVRWVENDCAASAHALEIVVTNAICY